MILRLHRGGNHGTRSTGLDEWHNGALSRHGTYLLTQAAWLMLYWQRRSKPIVSGATGEICHVGFGIGARRIAGMVEDRVFSCRIGRYWRVRGHLRVDPLGHMVITDDRMMSILTSRERIDKDAAALFETMMAYSGSCRIEDEVRLVIKVDAAWHPAWVGSEQLRFFNVDGDTLSITTAWQTHPKFPGRMARGVLTAQRL